MNILEKYGEGGQFMHVITLMAILSLVVAGIKVFRMSAQKEYNTNLLSLILMAGTFAVVLGMFSQILGVVVALDALRVAGDISPSLLYAGVMLSFYPIIWGCIVFFISFLLYFILKEIVKHKSHR